MATQVTELSNKQRAANTPERRAASSRGGRIAAEKMRQERNLNLAMMSDNEASRRATAGMSKEERRQYNRWIADHRAQLAHAESV